jgi:hypothetical protein
MHGVGSLDRRRFTGLGLSVAEQYASQGHRVVGMSRSVRPVDGLFDAWLTGATLPPRLPPHSAPAIERLYASGRNARRDHLHGRDALSGPLTEEPDALLRREIDTNYHRLCPSVPGGGAS